MVTSSTIEAPRKVCPVICDFGSSARLVFDNKHSPRRDFLEAFIFMLMGTLMDGLERGDRIQQQQQYVFQRRDIGKFAQDVFLRYED